MSNKKYWLWGGLIGLGVFILLFLTFSIIKWILGETCDHEICISNWQLYTSVKILAIIILWPVLIIPTLGISYLLPAVFYFVFGALVGWYYGRIKRRRKKDKGFTLIELLVVISIIGFLSAIVYSNIQSARIKARNVRTTSTVIQYTRALELYYDSYDQYPQQPDHIGVEFRVCLGDYSDDRCGRGVGEVGEDPAFNNIIKTYYPGMPVTETVDFGGTPFKGIVYACAEWKNVVGGSGAQCSKYALWWALQKPFQSCAPGSTLATDGAGNVVCRYCVAENCPVFSL